MKRDVSTGSRLTAYPASSWACSTTSASRSIPIPWTREPNARDEAALRQFTERYFPEAAGPTLALKTCMFTNTPDEHFIIDTLPERPQVSVAAGFSGHGFKFSSVVGEIMADLAEHGQTEHDIGLFRLGRFSALDVLADGRAVEKPLCQPVPGMNPYLESRRLWREVHNNIIHGMFRFLRRTLPFRYTVIMDERVPIGNDPSRDAPAQYGAPDLSIRGGGVSRACHCHLSDGRPGNRQAPPG